MAAGWTVPVPIQGLGPGRGGENVIYHGGQEVAVNVSSAGVTQVGVGTWEATGGHLVFSADLAMLTDAGLSTLLTAPNLLCIGE